MNVMMKRRRVPLLIIAGLILGGCAAVPVTATDPPAPVSPVAPGLGPEALPPPQQQHPSQPQPDSRNKTKRSHVDIHGLYMTGWTAGSDRFYELVTYMKRTGLNAAVIDVQDDDGHISWETEIALARQIGANERKIADIDQRVTFLKGNGIYVIGRIVVYADPLLGRKRPDMAIRGGEFIDTRGIRWPDPYNEQVWAYKIAVAKEAVARGFDEIQFDYIRFPEHRIDGYNAGVPVRQRTDAIAGFLQYAKRELEPQGVFISADVFGLTTSVAEGDDMEIGQDYTQIASIVDYILPMVYPSHYAAGTYGVANPNHSPGRIVYESLVAAQKRVGHGDTRKHRPWIQDFHMGKAYTAADVEDQIRGLAQAGIYQWILWDPNNRYTQDVNYALAGFTGPPGAWRATWEQTRAGAESAPANFGQKIKVKYF